MLPAMYQESGTFEPCYTTAMDLKLRRVKAHESFIMAVALQARGPRAASIDRNWQAVLWQGPERWKAFPKELRNFERLRFTEDGTRLIGGSLFDTHVWDASSGSLLLAAPGQFLTSLPEGRALIG